MALKRRHTVTAATTREIAWNYYANVDNWASHEGDAVEYIQLDGSFQSGVRGVTKMKGQAPREWLLVEVVPLEKAVTEVELPDAVIQFTWTFEEKNENQTLVTQEIEIKGPAAEQYTATLDTFAANLEAGMSKFVERLEDAS